MISSISETFSAPFLFTTRNIRFDRVPERSSCFSTSTESAICGISRAETRLPVSTVSNPTRSSAFIYRTLSRDGMIRGKPCIPSLGDSMILIIPCP